MRYAIVLVLFLVGCGGKTYEVATRGDVAEYSGEHKTFCTFDTWEFVGRSGYRNGVYVGAVGTDIYKCDDGVTLRVRE